MFVPYLSGIYVGRSLKTRFDSFKLVITNFIIIKFCNAELAVFLKDNKISQSGNM